MAVVRAPEGGYSKQDFSSLRAAVRASKSIVALTGAGISAESGIPTFRGQDGLWRNYSPERLATPQAFARDPRLVWEWYDWRRTLIQKAGPNRGHLALAELERRKACASAAQEGAGGATGKAESSSSNEQCEGGLTLVTQNVDGLHDRAGSRCLVKLHGDIWQVRCLGCGTTARNEEAPLRELPPRCFCGSLVRPGVVWFGEALPSVEWERALGASGRAQLFLAIGTSALVHPAAGLAEVAREAGARIGVLNPEPTPLDSLADWVLRGPAGDILPELL
jgi:NAD-dependent deacetylase